MKRRGHQLTAELEQAIVAFVRAGGFPHVAAEAAGVPREVFEDWLHRGSRPRAAKRYREFVEAIAQAQAQARLGAEANALAGKPLDWLRNGPGRDSATSAGWTGTVRPSTGRSGGPTLLDAEVQQLIRAMLAALEPFPEARAAVAAVLTRPSP
jgi:hypothetical protein